MNSESLKELDAEIDRVMAERKEKARAPQAVCYAIDDRLHALWMRRVKMVKEAESK